MKVQIIKLSDEYGGIIDSTSHYRDYIMCSEVSCDSELECCYCILNDDVRHRSELKISEIEL